MKIAIIDRHAITRIGITETLRLDLPDVTIFDSTDLISFVRKFPGQKPDIIITDLSHFDQGKGMSYINLLRTFFKGIKILVYEEGSDFLRIQRCISGQVQGYIFKQSEATELTRGIQQVIAGRSYICDKGLGLVISNLKLSQPPRQSAEFSAAENEVARYMSQGIEISGIAKRLRSNAIVVKRIQQNIYRKLEAKHRWSKRNGPTGL